MEESWIIQEGESLSICLTLPDTRSFTLQARIVFLVGENIEPERAENSRGAFLYEKGQRPDMTFVIYILNKIVLEELAREYFKLFSGFHLHDNMHTEGSVVCWSGKIETTERAKEILKQWLGLIGALTNSTKNDINEFYDPNDPDWLDNIPKSAGVKVILEEVQEGGIWRDDPNDSISLELSDVSNSNSHRLETNDELVWATKSASNFLPPNPSILYIASGTDISLESTFLQQAITYLDPDKAVGVKLLEDSKRNVVSEGIPTSVYQGKHDIIVLVNKNGNFGPIDILLYLKDDGIVLAQGKGWNFDAEQFLLSEQYTLIGVMDNEGEDFKTVELEEYTEVIQVANGSGVERTKFRIMGKWYIFRKK